jgi:hypothetical protein
VNGKRRIKKSFYSLFPIESHFGVVFQLFEPCFAVFVSSSS